MAASSWKVVIAVQGKEREVREEELDDYWSSRIPKFIVLMHLPFISGTIFTLIFNLEASWLLSLSASGIMVSFVDPQLIKLECLLNHLS